MRHRRKIVGRWPRRYRDSHQEPVRICCEMSSSIHPHARVETMNIYRADAPASKEYSSARRWLSRYCADTGIETMRLRSENGAPTASRRGSMPHSTETLVQSVRLYLIRLYQSISAQPRAATPGYLLHLPVRRSAKSFHVVINQIIGQRQLNL